MITIRMEEFSAGIMPRQSYTRPCVILYVMKGTKVLTLGAASSGR